MNADGSGVTRLTHNAAEDSEPAWSPNGRSIAFQSTRGSLGGYRIWIMNADGSGLRTLHISTILRGKQGLRPVDEVDPDWSPDGHSIAYADDLDGDYEIHVAKADGTPEEQLTFVSQQLTNTRGASYDPRWSPDGRSIAFVSDRD